MISAQEDTIITSDSAMAIICQEEKDKEVYNSPELKVPELKKNRLPKGMVYLKENEGRPKKTRSAREPENQIEACPQSCFVFCFLRYKLKLDVSNLVWH